jgi:hypothetical protein
MTRTKGAWCAVALGAALAVAATAVRAQNSERWYVVKIAGSPVGFASDVEKTEEGRSVMQSQMSLSLSRMGTALSMSMLLEEVCDGKGRFVEGSMEMTASASGMNAHAVLTGDTLEYRFDTGGSTTLRKIPWEAGAVSQCEADELLKAWLPSEEPEITIKTFRVDEGKFVDMRVVRREPETETVDGREQHIIVTEEFEGDAEVATSKTAYDESLEPYRTVMHQMGLEIVVERVSPDEMASIELEPNFDIIRQSMIPCTGYPDPPSKVHDVTFHLQMARPLGKNEHLDGPNQKEVGRGDDWIDLLVSREAVGRESGASFDRTPFVSPDRYIQSDAPELVAVADSIRAASGKTGRALAAEIARWVGGHITEKNFTQGFASALEVYHSRAGDCTEHSMLLTALLRACDIPARPAVGLAYSQGQLIGHMWAEAYVDGAWTTFDALDLDLTPIRIRISTSEKGEAVDQRALMQAYSVVGGMTASVIDYHLEQ